MEFEQLGKDRANYRENTFYRQLSGDLHRELWPRVLSRQSRVHASILLGISLAEEIRDSVSDFS